MDLEKQIEIIMASFDFEKCHNIMKVLGIKWPNPNGEMRIPSATDIADIALTLLDVSVREKEEFIFYNGLAITNHNGRLRISLEATSSGTPLIPLPNLEIDPSASSLKIV